MKQSCPKCKTIVEIDDSIYRPGDRVQEICPICGEQLEFIIPQPVVAGTNTENDSSTKPKKQMPKEPAPQAIEDKKKTDNAAAQNDEKPKTIVGKPFPKKTERTEIKKKNYGFVWVFLVAGIAVAALLTYILWYRPYKVDKEAARTYVIADNLFIRSSQESGVEYNQVGKAPYGSELITYERGSEWANVKWKNSLKGEAVRGFVSSNYIVDKEDFELLHSIWGDSDARETLRDTRYRFALIDYFKGKNITGGASGWQFYSMGKKATPNYFYAAKIYNNDSKYKDVFIVLKNNSTNEEILVCYSFDDDTEAPIFRGYWKLDDVSNVRIKKVSNIKHDSYRFSIKFADGNEYWFYK